MVPSLIYVFDICFFVLFNDWKRNLGIFERQNKVRNFLKTVNKAQNQGRKTLKFKALPFWFDRYTPTDGRNADAEVSFLEITTLVV